MATSTLLKPARKYSPLVLSDFQILNSKNSFHIKFRNAGLEFQRAFGIIMQIHAELHPTCFKYSFDCQPGLVFLSGSKPELY